MPLDRDLYFFSTALHVAAIEDAGAVLFDENLDAVTAEVAVAVATVTVAAV